MGFWRIDGILEENDGVLEEIGGKRCGFGENDGVLDEIDGFCYVTAQIFELNITTDLNRTSADGLRV